MKIKGLLRIKAVFSSKNNYFDPVRLSCIIQKAMIRHQIYFDQISVLRFFQKKGFSLVELLTTMSIVGTLSVVGIKSYQAQTNKARSAEAKHSLSYVFTAEESFKDIWSTYHENLAAIGAVPSGAYHYDVGFGISAVLSTADGELGIYPLKSSLDIRECTNFDQICKGECLSKTETAVEAIDPAQAVYFNLADPLDSSNPYNAVANCQVMGSEQLSTYTGNSGDPDHESNAKAEVGTFKAFAIGNLKGVDVWSIDDKRTVQHVKDGTE